MAHVTMQEIDAHPPLPAVLLITVFDDGGDQVAIKAFAVGDEEAAWEWSAEKIKETQ